MCKASPTRRRRERAKRTKRSMWERLHDDLPKDQVSDVAGVVTPETFMRLRTKKDETIDVNLFVVDSAMVDPTGEPQLPMPRSSSNGGAKSVLESSDHPAIDPPSSGATVVHSASVVPVDATLPGGAVHHNQTGSENNADPIASWICSKMANRHVPEQGAHEVLAETLRMHLQMIRHPGVPTEVKVQWEPLLQQAKTVLHAGNLPKCVIMDHLLMDRLVQLAPELDRAWTSKPEGKTQ